MTRAAAAAAFCVLLAACAPPAPPSLPSGAGAAFPGFAAAYNGAVSACSGIHTYTAVLALSGRAGRTKLRGRIEAGFAAPARMRLTGVPPFGGRPVFVLTAADDEGTLVLPRDERVLAGAPPAEIVEALAGVRLGAADLRSAVTGCGLWAGEAPVSGRTYPGGWAALSFSEGTAYLREDAGAWRYAAATRGPLSLYYSDYADGRPAAIRLRAASSGRVTADLTLRVSQVEIDVPLGDRVFAAEVPDSAAPMTLDELRRAGPLGEHGG